MSNPAVDPLKEALVNSIMEHTYLSTGKKVDGDGFLSLAFRTPDELLAIHKDAGFPLSEEIKKMVEDRKFRIYRRRVSQPHNYGGRNSWTELSWNGKTLVSGQPATILGKRYESVTLRTFKQIFKGRNVEVVDLPALHHNFKG